MPKHDSTGRASRRSVEGRVFAIDQAQLVLLVADAKLTVSWALEVRFDAQQFSVPPLRRLQIGRPITDRRESSQCLGIAHKRFPPSVSMISSLRHAPWVVMNPCCLMKRSAM